VASGFLDVTGSETDTKRKDGKRKRGKKAVGQRGEGSRVTNPVRGHKEDPPGGKGCLKRKGRKVGEGGIPKRKKPLNVYSCV